jgi:glycine/D-amino acid oxidase-like deaminating enzyme
LKEKPKKIVVVGSGLAGITAAYYLSNNPLNNVVIIEKNDSAYSGTSY